MSEARAGHRSLRIPRLLRIVPDRPAVRAALAGLARERGGAPTFLFVHTGAASGTGYGVALASDARAAGLAVSECVAAAATRETVAAVAARIAEERPDFVVGIGGGRIVDVAKLAAAQHETEFISVPTQVSSDGICSPVAVIVADGRPQSLPARIPAGIIVDEEVLASAPLATWRSGLGDLVSNLSAVSDWRLAHARHGEEIDDFACLTSEAAALSVVEDEADLSEPAFRQKLIRGLILSGIAMEMAGSSRPASGAEHLISHALDGILERPRLHGLQVALGTIAAQVLRGDTPRRLVSWFRLVGLPVLPGDLGISLDDFGTAMRCGPSTRPGRWTVLDTVTDAEIDRLVEAYSRNAEGPWE